MGFWRIVGRIVTFGVYKGKRLSKEEKDFESHMSELNKWSVGMDKFRAKRRVWGYTSARNALVKLDKDLASIEEQILEMPDGASKTELEVNIKIRKEGPKRLDYFKEEYDAR